MESTMNEGSDSADAKLPSNKQIANSRITAKIKAAWKCFVEATNQPMPSTTYIFYAKRRFLSLNEV
jgi:hypothetical protein